MGAVMHRLRIEDGPSELGVENVMYCWKFCAEKVTCNQCCSQLAKRGLQKSLKAPCLLVGTARFELTTSRTPSERATRLRYVPITELLD